MTWAGHRLWQPEDRTRINAASFGGHFMNHRAQRPFEERSSNKQAAQKDVQHILFADTAEHPSNISMSSRLYCLVPSRTPTLVVLRQLTNTISRMPRRGRTPPQPS